MEAPVVAWPKYLCLSFKTGTSMRSPHSQRTTMPFTASLHQQMSKRAINQCDEGVITILPFPGWVDLPAATFLMLGARQILSNVLKDMIPHLDKYLHEQCKLRDFDCLSRWPWGAAWAERCDTSLVTTSTGPPSSRVWCKCGNVGHPW